MTKKELINMLAVYPDHIEIILSKDSEGNEYSPLSSTPMYPAKYIPETSWYGEILDPTDPGNAVDITHPKAVDAIVLYPIN